MRRAIGGMAVVQVALLIAGLGGAVGVAEAKSLRDHLIDMAPRQGFDVTDDTDTVVATIVPSKIEAASIGMADAVQRLAVRGTDFPVASTVPGFSYVYDPQLQSFTRSKMLGPVFAERAETVGRGRMEFGAAYLYADLDKVDGGDFEAAGGLAGLTSINADLLQLIQIDSFRLATHTTNLYGTFGITDRWDVNVLVPLMYSQLRVRGRVSYALLFPDNTTSGFTPAQKVRADGDAFGVGDVLIRTKFRVSQEPIGFAAALTIRTPTGNEENFQGLGDVTVTPTAIATVPLGPVSIHGTLGFEVNADDLERTRARYTLGGTYQALENLALLVDVLGSSSLVDDSFDGRGVATGLGADSSGPFVPQSNIVDVATGLKLSMGDHALLYVGAIVPLTRDGMRADVIPTGGVEVGF